MMVWPQASAICCVRLRVTSHHWLRPRPTALPVTTAAPHGLIGLIGPHVEATRALFKHPVIHLLTVKMCTAAFPTARMSMITCVYVHGQLHVSPRQGLISLNLKNIHNWGFARSQKHQGSWKQVNPADVTLMLVTEREIRCRRLIWDQPRWRQLVWTSHTRRKYTPERSFTILNIV